MSVDYKGIADAAEGYADYQTAFAAMTQESETKHREISSNSVRRWCAQNGTDYAIIKNGTDVLNEMAYLQINLDSSPLGLNDPQVIGFVNALSISDGGKASLIGMGEYERPIWANLKAGHVQNAMQKREAGEV